MSDSPLLPPSNRSSNVNFDHLPEGLRPSIIEREDTIDMEKCLKCGELYDRNKFINCCSSVTVCQLIYPTSSISVRQPKRRTKRLWCMRFFCFF